MLKFIKHTALLFLFFVAYQIITGFLMVGPTLQAIPEFPAHAERECTGQCMPATHICRCEQKGQKADGYGGIRACRACRQS